MVVIVNSKRLPKRQPSTEETMKLNNYTQIQSELHELKKSESEEQKIKELEKRLNDFHNKGIHPYLFHRDDTYSIDMTLGFLPNDYGVRHDDNLDSYIASKGIGKGVIYILGEMFDRYAKNGKFSLGKQGDQTMISDGAFSVKCGEDWHTSLYETVESKNPLDKVLVNMSVSGAKTIRDLPPGLEKYNKDQLGEDDFSPGMSLWVFSLIQEFNKKRIVKRQIEEGMARLELQ